VNITPQSVLLTSGQAATFQATDAAGQPVAVAWSLNPAVGSLNPIPPTAATQTTSVTFIAPPLVSIAQTVTIIAATATDSASATISLTPDPIVIVPPKVDLKAGESQYFVAIVAGAPVAVASTPQPGGGQPIQTASAPGVTWVLSPTSQGSLDRQSGLYTAPNTVGDSVAVTVTATAAGFGKSASATVNLVPLPWRGRSVHMLGAYLLIIFSLVYLLVALWPRALPAPEVARGERLEAEKTLQDRTSALNAVRSAAKLSAELSTQARAAAAAAPKDQTKIQAASVAGAQAKADSDAEDLAEKEKKRAYDDLVDDEGIEHEVKDPYITISRGRRISRENDILLLVLLAGALGGFLHAARSYTEFLGNEQLKRSWAWWYGMAPFTGAILALVFYAALRGGFLALNAGSNTKASDLNPYGIAAMAAVVGMFSKDATTKLGEMFKTLFNSEKAKEAKDSLKADS